MGYFPNGTSMEDYESRWCARCLHDRDEHPCAVRLLHFFRNYDECNNPESALHVLIPRGPKGENLQCRMFLGTSAATLADRRGWRPIA